MARLSILKSSIITEDVMRMIFSRPFQYVFASVVTGFLLFFLTLLIGLSSHLSDVSSGLSEKLGIYFYISAEQDPIQTNNQTLSLMKELEDANIQAEYISQDQAEGFIQNKLPAIAQRFKEYNVDTKLPATLFITIDSEKTYLMLQDIIPNYATLIQNSGDISQAESVQGQELRIIKALDFARFLRGSSLGLVIVFSFLVLVTVLLVLQLKLKQFEHILSLKKLLGASYSQMRSPFLVFVGLLLSAGYLFSIVLGTILSLGTMGSDKSLVYFSQLLGVEVLPMGVSSLLLSNYLIVILLVLVLVGVIMMFSSFAIERAIRKAN